MKNRCTQRGFPPCLFLGAILLNPAAATAQDQNRSQAPAREFNPRTVVNRTFKPIVDAPIIAAREVTNQVSDNELVIGVTINGSARAYPINMLTGPSREIINDTLGDRAIAATW